ncbi:Variant SH3 domain containing protein [Tritrichomonas foetus]|uniref:Variant SH3 domain containing protein n=1 Tax=Tritrichomonas foetus TaxID=1144522 RepID=A0A1J4JHH0_9EUKA|nr:Variant SH3 domain containing protein [Tritrichomonas foetus]|eukprot:OHS98582.1 Variant SH3 domain containing protein [Tritrichomonas foetus]
MALASGDELVTIFKRIKTRIIQGGKNYDTLFAILAKRADIEEKFARDIKALIPADSDKEDALLQSVLNELRTESEIHSRFSTELKSKVIVPMDKDGKKLKDQSKGILSDLKKISTPVKKSVGDAHKAQKALEDANAILSTLPATKKDPQVKKIQKLSAEMNQKVVKANQAADAAKGVGVPKIHQAFSKFDSDRLGKMQNYTINFVASKKGYSQKIVDNCSSLTTRAAALDSDDRSKRYVNNVFHTSTGEEVKENEVNVVIAIADFRSEEPGDLQFRRGDRIHVTLEHNSGWWEGQMDDGKKGLFPRSYVEIAGAPRGPIPINAVFNAYDDFLGGQPQFVDLLNGDLVFVDVLAKDGFCKGINLRTHKKGAFPIAALEHSV